MRCPVILGVSALAIVLVVPAFAVPLPLSALPLDYSSLYSPDWPMYGHDLWGTHFNSVETAVNESTVGSLVEKWRVDGIGMYGTPAVSQGTVYVSTAAGDVVALDAVSGALKWTTHTGLTMTASPAVANGLVFVTNLGPDARVWALDTATGTLVWSSVIDQYAAGWGSPVVVGPLVIVGQSGGDEESGTQPHRGSLQAFNAATGSLVWRTYTVAPGHLGGAVWSTPAVLNDLVYIGTGNSFDGVPDPGNTAMMAFSLETGAIVWSHQFEDFGDEDFGASPQVFPTQAGFVVGEMQKSHYHELDAATGDLRWSITLPVNWSVIGTPAAAYGAIYSAGSEATPDGYPVGDFCLGVEDGSVLWSHPSTGSFSAAAAAGGVIFMPETIGILHAYDAATGLELWNSTLPGNTYSGPVISHGLVHMGTSTGLVVYGLPS